MPSLHFSMFPTGYLKLYKTYLSLERLSPLLSFLWHTMEVCIPMWLQVPCICSIYGVTADPAVKKWVGKDRGRVHIYLVSLPHLRRNTAQERGQAQLWKSLRPGIEQMWIHDRCWRTQVISPGLLICCIRKLTQRSANPNPRRWKQPTKAVAGPRDNGGVETAAEMHRERDKDTKSQSQAEQMQKMRRKMEFCRHSFNPDSYWSSWLETKPDKTNPIWNSQKVEGKWPWNHLLHLPVKKKRCVLIKKKIDQKEERAQSAQDCVQLRFSLCNFLLL